MSYPFLAGRIRKGRLRFLSRSVQRVIPQAALPRPSFIACCLVAGLHVPHFREQGRAGESNEKNRGRSTLAVRISGEATGRWYMSGCWDASSKTS